MLHAWRPRGGDCCSFFVFAGCKFASFVFFFRRGFFFPCFRLPKYLSLFLFCHFFVFVFLWWRRSIISVAAVNASSFPGVACMLGARAAVVTAARFSSFADGKFASFVFFFCGGFFFPCFLLPTYFSVFVLSLLSLCLYFCGGGEALFLLLLLTLLLSFPWCCMLGARAVVTAARFSSLQPVSLRLLFFSSVVVSFFPV